MNGGAWAVVPTSAFLNPAVLPTATECGAAITSNESSIQLYKNLASTGRAKPTDQFNVLIRDPAEASPLISLASGASGGSTTGVIADTGAYRATAGSSYTLTDAMASASGGNLADYTPTIACTRNGTAFTPSGAAPNWTVTVASATGEKILCTITNTRIMVAPVALDDSRLNRIYGATVSFDPLANDTDVGSTIDPTSVKLTLTGMPSGTTLSVDGKSMVVPGEGTWTINPTTGFVTFVPLVGTQIQNMTPAKYTVADTDGLVSNEAAIAVTYVANPRLTIAKVGPVAPIYEGQTVSYTVTATNAGNIALTNVVVSDPKLTPTSITCPTLAVGATCVLSGTLKVTYVDTIAGSVVNTASASADGAATVNTSNTKATAQGYTGPTDPATSDANCVYIHNMDGANPPDYGSSIYYKLAPHRYADGYHVANTAEFVNISSWSMYGATGILADASGSGKFIWHYTDGPVAGNVVVWQNPTPLTVQPNTSYKLNFKVANINSYTFATLGASINGSTIGADAAVAGTGAWVQRSHVWNSGAATTADFTIFCPSSNDLEQAA